MFWAILLCELGEENPSGGEPSDNGGDPLSENSDEDNNADPKADPNNSGGEGLGAAPEKGQGSTPPATPKYGEFGDSPTVDQLYQALSGRTKEFETVKGKMSATERNLSALRKTLEGSGIRAVPDEDGNLKLEVASKEPTKRQTKFTDSHKTLFDEKVLDAISLLIEDRFEDFYGSRQRATQEQQAKVKQFISAKKEANDLMITYFPALDGKFDANGKATNADFNQAFYDRATEIWQEKYRNDPRGELLSALQAAKELNVIPTAITAAKKEGIELGKAGKKILGPVTPSGGKGTPKGRLSRDEYFKLSDEEREKYDKEQLNKK
jgi:hypothetical protein